jgi:hypothetical protein
MLDVYQRFRKLGGCYLEVSNFEEISGKSDIILTVGYDRVMTI